VSRRAHRRLRRAGAGAPAPPRDPRVDCHADTKTCLNGRVSRAPSRPLGFARAFPALAAVAAAACVSPVSISIGRIDTLDPALADCVQTGAPSPAWRRVAVLPFGGDPAHRRPAEELVAVELRRRTPLQVASPFPTQRALLARGPGGVAEDAERWALAYLEAPVGAVPREELRGIARVLAADALVLGRIAPFGLSADLVVVDGASGDAVAAVRRAGGARAAELGLHDLAMDSTARASRTSSGSSGAPAGRVPRLPARSGARRRRGERREVYAIPRAP